MKIQNIIQNMNKLVWFVCAISCFFIGCETLPQRVDVRNDQGHTTMALDYRDFAEAAREAIQGMTESGCLNRPAGKPRYVLAISRIKNDTVINVDPDQLIKKIRIALMQTGKVSVTTAYKLGGAEDELVEGLKEETGADDATVLPDISLSGKIIGTQHKYDNSTQQLEYYLQLTLTDLKSGLSIWEGETPVVKRGSSSTVAW